MNGITFEGKVLSAQVVSISNTTGAISAVIESSNKRFLLGSNGDVLQVYMMAAALLNAAKEKDVEVAFKGDVIHTEKSAFGTLFTIRVRMIWALDYVVEIKTNDV